MFFAFFLDYCTLDGKKDACMIFEILTRSMKYWELDFDKCVGFRSDGALTMIGKHNKVSARLKEKINSFLTSVHCVTYRTNLTAIDVTKVGLCKAMSREIDVLLNLVTMHFKKSCKNKVHCFDCKKNLLILQFF